MSAETIDIRIIVRGGLVEAVYTNSHNSTKVDVDVYDMDVQDDDDTLAYLSEAEDVLIASPQWSGVW